MIRPHGHEVGGWDSSLIVRPEMDARRTHNAALNEQEYRSRAARLRSYPRFVFVELTENCNLHCPMCRPHRRRDRALDMPYDVFESVASTLFPHAELVDLRGWGESLVYPRIADAIRFASSFGCQLKIYTNLTVSHHRILEALIEHRVITAISFDAASGKLFEELRGGASLSRVLKNLKCLVAMRDASSVASEMIYLSVTVQERNLAELADIAKIASEHGIRLLKLFPLCTSILDGNHPFRHRDRLRASLDHLCSVAEDAGIRIELGASLHPDLTDTGALFDRCSHPWTHCYVAYDGGIGFCDHLIGIPNYKLGSWSAGSFHGVWNNERFRALRSEHSSIPREISESFEACRWCYHFRYSDVEHWLRLGESSRLVSSSGGQRLYPLRVVPRDRPPRLTFP